MNKYFLFIAFYSLFNLLSYEPSFGQDTLILNDNKIERNFGKKLMLYTDSNNNFNIENEKHDEKFIKLTSNVPNLGVSTETFWLKFFVKNISIDQNYTLQLPLPTIDYLDFYLVDSKNNIVKHEVTGDRVPYFKREFDNPIYTFNFSLIPDEKYTIFLKIRGGEQLQAPLILGQSSDLIDEMMNSFVIFGLYIGIVSVMFIYNLFLYISTRDESYLFYILYIFIISLTQANFQGYAFKFLWPNNIWLSTYAVYILSSAAAMSAIEFMKQFLQTKSFLPLLHKTLNIFYLPYIFAIIFAFYGNLNLGYKIIQVTAIIAALYMLVVAYAVYLKGYKPAKYFLFAWTVFLIGVCSFVLKDYNILEYNIFTYNMMPFGSALEVTLLSFALADKINTFKKQKEESQAEALKISLENEKLILEQNTELEKNVNERTLELQESNKTLEFTLKDLKEAQSQLVDSEKMASLGQLTAGIAHEINNPINFVTSNIKPLELDINDLNEVINLYEKLDIHGDLSLQISKIESFKKEIDLNYVRDEIKSLLSGIGDGARRTAEIIRSLKNFSRLDENDTKPVDLNEGIDSTLVLIKNTFPGYLTVIKNYGLLPDVECLPGKINQVFMNLITNAVQAVQSKPYHNAEELIIITTWIDDDKVKISFKDSGTGMPADVKLKIFEPFFTTKDVGEGTGLGLSIVFRIIESHHGTIEVNTKINEGTEFIITLPVNNT